MLGSTHSQNSSQQSKINTARCITHWFQLCSKGTDAGKHVQQVLLSSIHKALRLVVLTCFTKIFYWFSSAGGNSNGQEFQHRLLHCLVLFRAGCQLVPKCQCLSGALPLHERILLVFTRYKYVSQKAQCRLHLSVIVDIVQSQ